MNNRIKSVVCGVLGLNVGVAITRLEETDSPILSVLTIISGIVVFAFLIKSIKN